jgi:hypothetical protein
LRLLRIRTWAAGAALVAALAAGCGGQRDPVDDPAFHSAVSSGKAGAEVTFDGTARGEPVRAGTHEHIRLQAATGELVEIDHNVDLAPWVPAHSGDQLRVHGRLYIDPGRVGVHCTHAHTSQGCPYPGWIELGQSFYE